MLVDDLRELWNKQADSMNQWNELGLDEIVAFAQKVEKERIIDIVAREYCRDPADVRETLTE